MLGSMERHQPGLEEYPPEPDFRDVEPERLIRPLLFRAGIVDLNQAYDVLPEDQVQRLGTWQKFQKEEQISFRTVGVMKAAFERLNMRNEKLSFNRLIRHRMYPFAAGGYIDRLSETQYFERILNIQQLNWNNGYPLSNYHSRGDHSIYTAINMVRTIAALAERDPARLEERLRRDFAEASFYSEDLSRNSLFDLAVDLAVTAGMLHDLATPAGGDLIKHVAGLNEEEDIVWLLTNDLPEYKEGRDELWRILATQGLDEAHVNFVTDCIAGRSASLIGDLIHLLKKEVTCLNRIV